MTFRDQNMHMLAAKFGRALDLQLPNGFDVLFRQQAVQENFRWAHKGVEESSVREDPPARSPNRHTHTLSLLPHRSPESSVQSPLAYPPPTLA